MTDLVERLREVGRDGVWKSGRNPKTAHPMCIKAADRIEQLEAEIARKDVLIEKAAQAAIDASAEAVRAHRYDPNTHWFAESANTCILRREHRNDIADHLSRALSPKTIIERVM